MIIAEPPPPPRNRSVVSLTRQWSENSFWAIFGCFFFKRIFDKYQLEGCSVCRIYIYRFFERNTKTLKTFLYTKKQIFVDGHFLNKSVGTDKLTRTAIHLLIAKIDIWRGKSQESHIVAFPYMVFYIMAIDENSIHMAILETVLAKLVCLTRSETTFQMVYERASNKGQLLDQCQGDFREKSCRFITQRKMLACEIFVLIY